MCKKRLPFLWEMETSKSVETTISVEVNVFGEGSIDVEAINEACESKELIDDVLIDNSELPFVWKLVVIVVFRRIVTAY